MPAANLGFYHTPTLLRQALQHNVLARDEELALLRTANDSDEERPPAEKLAARNDLLRQNLKLIRHVTHQIARKKRYTATEAEDAFQDGVIAVIGSIDGFREEFGTRLSTYAMPRILARVVRYTDDQLRDIPVPSWLKVHAWRFRRYYKECLAENPSREPTNEMIVARFAAELHRDEFPRAKTMKDALVEAARIMELLEIASMDPARLDHPAIADGEIDGAMHDLLPDTNSADMEENASTQRLIDIIYDVVDRLPPRQARLINLRYPRTGENFRTLEAVGEIMGVTRARIGQIERLAFDNIRHELRRFF